MDLPLTSSQQKLRGKQVTDMTDAQLSDWIDACNTMERFLKSPKSRRSWKGARARALAEIERRAAKHTAYRLIPAQPGDRDWLDQLRRAAYASLFVATWGGWDEQRHLRHFAHCWEGGDIFVIELQGERVGMVQLFESGATVEVGELQVQPRHQGQGIGSRVLRDTLAQAHARGQKVILSTGLQNVRAVRLYERLGFVHVSPTETHFHMESGPGD